MKIILAKVVYFTGQFCKWAAICLIGLMTALILALKIYTISTTPWKTHIHTFTECTMCMVVIIFSLAVYNWAAEKLNK